MIRKGLARGLALAIVLTAAAAADAGTEARRHALAFDVYAGGFDVAVLNIGVDIAPETYDVRVWLKTTGLLAFFAPYSMSATAQGTVDALRVRPARFVSTDKWGGGKHWSRIDFGPDGLAKWETDRDKSPKQIPAPFRRDVLDIASAIIQIVVEMDRGADCGRSVPVFDGKRRFDFELSPVERVTLEPTRYSVFRGDAWVCKIGVTPVHGKMRKGGVWDRAGDTARVWIGRVFENAAPLPVRLQARTRFGYIVIHLKRAELNGPGATPQLVEQAR